MWWICSSIISGIPGKSQCMSGRKKHEVCSGDPRLVDAVKMRLIQTIKGSQYLHSRPGTPEKNNLEPVIATRKTDFVGFDPAAAIYLQMFL
jgi:hypothetical protein